MRVRSVLTLQLNERLFYAYVRTMEYSLTGLHVRVYVCVFVRCKLQYRHSSHLYTQYTYRV